MSDSNLPSESNLLCESNVPASSALVDAPDKIAD